MPPLPVPRGGRAMPVKPPKPKAPRLVRPKPIDPNAQASQNAMSAFRTALAQLQSSTPAVDANAIYAPYRASEAITGQLGTGLQQAELNSGQAAQQQYGQALGQAQQQAAQFGISAGAGANPTALQNTGAAPLAQQTNAYAAAAPQAAAQWQQLLERSAAAKVADAGLQRQASLTAAQQSLAGNIPGAIQNEKQLAFQQDTQRQNMNLARTQLTAKQQAELRNYGLDVAKTQQSGQVAATRASQTQQGLDERARHDLATEKTAQKALQVRAQKATKGGLKGVSGAVKALQGTTSGSSTKKVAKGWDVQVQPIDSDGNPLGPVVKQHGPREDWHPPGYRNVGGATTHYATAPNTPGKTGVTASQWDQQMRSLLAQNPGQSKAIKSFLGPRPKK